MTDQPLSPAPPAWVAKRDGRLVPFEADKISRSLFAATEDLGRPDAFLARELTDGVVHFLGADVADATPSTAQVADMVVKVVRELGQPALAQAYADFRHQRQKRRKAGQPGPSLLVTPAPAEFLGPSRDRLSHWVETGLAPEDLTRRAAGACLREYSLREVFARDLVAAQADGLLTLTGLEAPLELAAAVLDPPAAGDWGVAEAVERARQVAGKVVAIDGPEYHLAPTSGLPGYARELEIALRATGLEAVVNLNGASPPRWANDLAEGPLFREDPPPELAEVRTGDADLLLERGWQPAGRVRLFWHFGARDVGAGAGARLVNAARRALAGGPVTFVFDRPRRPLGLAEGVDRHNPAVLLTVGLSLPRLAMQGGSAADPARFLQKLGSLARLALSAGVQKRDFLRRHGRVRPALTRGFLLDRARLVVVPIGLEAVVRDMAGEGLCGKTAGLELARQILARLRDVLREDGRRCRLETCLESAADFALGPRAEEPPARPPLPEVAGVTPWDAEATPRHQLKAAGSLHAAAEGTAAILIPPENPLAAEEAADLIRYAWQATDVTRFRFVRAGPLPLPASPPPGLF